MSQVAFTDRSEYVLNWRDDILLYQGVSQAFDEGVYFVKSIQEGGTTFTSDHAITGIAARHMRIGNDQCATPCFEENGVEVFITEVRGTQYYIVNELRGIALAVFRDGAIGQILLMQLLKAFDVNNIHFRSAVTNTPINTIAAISGAIIAKGDGKSLVNCIAVNSFGLTPGTGTVELHNDADRVLVERLDTLGSRHRVFRSIWTDENICDSFHEFLRASVWGG